MTASRKPCLWTASLVLALGACQQQTPPTEPNSPIEAQTTADTSAQPARSTDAPTPMAETATATPAAAVDPAAFVGKVWRVKEASAVEPGTTYAFLADGTLVIDSPNGTPLYGQWTFADGALTLVEEGLSYPADILKLDAGAFHLRSHNPGGAVDIQLVPAPDVALPTRK
ncbi:hypothetical protein ACFOLC_10225 [Lysobacter cavernae]|uniref:Copper resistance protein NlpE n=1 Tax=Lysobacter cavernae TaxID=1685901 RepID=A0ABV7RPH4_9GAMM